MITQESVVRSQNSHSNLHTLGAFAEVQKHPSCNGGFHYAILSFLIAANKSFYCRREEPSDKPPIEGGVVMELQY